MTSSSSHSRTKVCYYYDKVIGEYSYGEDHPMIPHRIRMTHNLLLKYGLFRKMEIYRPHRATAEEMMNFHSDDYIRFLRSIQPDNMARFKKQMQRFNVREDADCPVFDGLYEFCQISAGGSIAGAVKLNKKDADIAINWAGGLHHAKKSKASGFCYVNDIVLAIMELLKCHQRVLYIDIDIHHGDAVEEAFYSTDRVMTVSFHKYGGKFFPRTGALRDVGKGKGKYYYVNFPLKDGIDDISYESIFKAVMTKVMETYQPSAVVLQCGADSLTEDFLGSFNLTVKGHAKCVEFLKSYNLPLLLLGGGGYTISNVARCWTYETAVALGWEIPNELPNKEYLKDFGPDFRLHVDPSSMANQNTPQYLDETKTRLLENLRMLPCAPGVQLQDIPEDGLNTEDLEEEEEANPDNRISIRASDKRVINDNEFSDSEDQDEDKGGQRYQRFKKQKISLAPQDVGRSKKRASVKETCVIDSETDSSSSDADSSSDSDASKAEKNGMGPKSLFKKLLPSAPGVQLQDAPEDGMLVDDLEEEESTNPDGEGNSEDSSNLGYWKCLARDLEAGQSYWKSKAGELSNQKLESDKGQAYWKLKATEMASQMASQKLESDKKIWDLEADLAYWKGKAKELERNCVEVEKIVDPFELPGFESAAANSRYSTAQSSSSPSVVDLTENGCSELISSEVIGVRQGEAYQSKQGSISGSSHPLLDEKVMKHVFQYIMSQPNRDDVLNDIKNFRQVCKPWRNAATRLYRQCIPALKFGGYDYDFHLFTFGKLKKFLETMKDSTMVPFQCYDITGSVSDYENKKLMEDFLRICGPDIVSVHFHLKETGTFHENFDINGSPELNLSKLKTLCVDVVGYTAHSIPDVHGHRRLTFDPRSHLSNALETFTGFVLSAAKSLRKFKLELSSLSYEQKTSTSTIENIFRRIPKSVKVLNLQIFLTDQILTCLVEKGLSLEEFGFHAYYSYIKIKQGDINSFLRNQSVHLKVLRMFGSTCSYLESCCPQTLDLPLLSKLETLKLSNVNYRHAPCPYEKFPNLICLDVEEWKTRSKFVSYFFGYSNTTAPSVKKLILPTQIDMTPIIKTCAEYFPNITELRLVQMGGISRSKLLGNVLEEIFTHLCNLEVLYITVQFQRYVETNLDSIFSGVPEEDCEKICMDRKYDEVNLAGMQRKASMLNMKRLRRLVLVTKQEDVYNDIYSKAVTLTDFSVHFVFLKMAALQELELIFGFHPKAKVSDDYLQRLKAKLLLKLESG